MNILKIAGLALLLAAATSGWGQTYYKWTDDEGTTHFTASPPPDRPYETVDTSISVITPSSAPAADADADARSEAEDAGDEAGDEAQMPRRAEPDPEVVAARCTQARENLFWLENRRRIEVERADGTVEVVEGEAREAQIAETRAFLEEWCEDNG
ncbi:DUF4124 domain-containing protein [Wenzhouxiangella sp. XN79A]|uniref:DUF4124 domain-containing protein n=1 Tax=Wenzhouxiangella sp. XN79A TaxID=2724193 RepID=UPI00144AA3DA|nr:DUF4124 domain-containing protein [Wenzhouxiangella sp. XN79A]NKI35045.1 DUF4124 domain-containing protein [Wenzhouxiangella sp. XN79A]